MHCSLKCTAKFVDECGPALLDQRYRGQLPQVLVVDGVRILIMLISNLIIFPGATKLDSTRTALLKVSPLL